MIPFAGEQANLARFGINSSDRGGGSRSKHFFSD